MLTLIIAIALFLFNFTAGLVGLLAYALGGSYFLAYAITWGVEIALGLLFFVLGFSGAVAALVRHKF